jgi:hypothetical protein
MACKLHNATACVPCARVALAIQTENSSPTGFRPNTEAKGGGFKGRSFRTPLHEKGVK